ncbi:aspartate/glutamate racemase family protein [Desulfococcaceae bacterium HSG8]|nr:aspartate/glutamate racemase family protein [Desulfococcaceae bacterium HSG8]
MTIYHVQNKKQCWYGTPIGILVLNTAYPCIPGSVANATTFSFPVRYKIVEKESVGHTLKQEDRTLLNPFIDAAVELQNEGVKAITGTGGFIGPFQKEVSDVIGVPVFLSSLLQIPFIYQTVKRPIGVITSDSRLLNSEYFASVGLTRGIPLIIRGMEAQPGFRNAIIEEKGSLDADAIEKEAVGIAREIITENFDIGAILLECSELSPYAYAIQQETDLPVFDFITMINYVHSALIRKEFQGYM